MSGIMTIAGDTPMHKLARLALATVLISGCATVAAAGDLKLTLNNGRVTLIAQDVPLRQILDEWARVGKTTIVNGDKLSGPPLTLQLVDQPEREVLDVLLRSASGYIVAQKDVTAPGASVFDKVMILPVSRGPVGVAANTPPTPFNNRPMPMQQPMPVPDDDDPPGEQPPQVLPPGVIVPGGGQNPPVVQTAPGQQPPLTAPRPGFLPAPPAGQPNPYGPPMVPGGQPMVPGGQPMVPGAQPLPPGALVPGIQSPVPGQVPVVRPPGGPGGEDDR
jgi:hypothetical protein